MSQPSTPANEVQAEAAAPGRKKALALVAAAVVLGGIGYGAYYALVASHFEHTDNAYVQANVVQITPQVGGTVVAIAADDTDKVKAGQVLVRLDPADARVALDQAEAQLAQTVREVRTLFANNGSLQAQVALRQADVTRAQTELARAQDDVNRRSPLLASGAVGKEEFNHASAQLAAARSAVAAAESALVAAREQLGSNQSLTDGTTVAQHPNVARAAARVRETYLAFQRAALLAPVDGHVAKRSVQVGQRVQAGSPVMALVTLDQPWVDANFKESQLQRIRIGQPATLTADVYGQKVTYHGKVVGLGAGTGAAFSLLPAQNATGNWIKVVQRVPVRLSLDAAEVRAHPLRVGLSMEVEVDVAQQDGPVLAQVPREHAVAQTTVFDALQKDADAQVRRIIDANLGRAQGAAAARAAAVATPRRGA
ncbi:MAG: biotin/lipoyl-binding protein [Proteobacteria bacterium]|uniref:HlyD family secretion protein n=1 Tax=Aquabacterium sp. TaxID=1872578 RepID=UPI0035C71D98|nr:biotin/lipoyl-binding protein [Pseudomonadota bacterium]